MPPKTPRTKVYFPPESTQKVKDGIDILAQAVSSTLGARSRAVGLSNGEFGKITKDGVSVAKSIHLEDLVQDYGVQVVVEAARKTNDRVGDGTTGTIILAHALITEAQKSINSGISPMAIRPLLEERVNKLIKELDQYVMPVKTLSQKIAVATISANGDEALGKLIAETLDKIGDQGVMTAEDTKDPETRVEFQEGVQFDKGMVNEGFFTDFERRTASLEDAPVLITDKPLKEINDVRGWLEKVVVPKSLQLVIISPEISGNALPSLLQTKLNGNFMSLPINAPYVGATQKEFLLDLCALTGAKFVSQEAGTEFKDLKYEDLGQIKRITSTKTATIITGSEPTEAVSARIAGIKTQLEDPDITDFEKEKLKERYGKLTQGIAVLKLGAITEIELKERRERVIDAISATQSAIKHGVVIGGEVVYLKLREYLNEQKFTNTLNSQIDTILLEALKAPFYILMRNSGLEPGEFMPYIKGNDGVDVTDGKVKDFIKAGIVDPVEVLRESLLNATSVANQILSLGSVIVPAPEEKHAS